MGSQGIFSFVITTIYNLLNSMEKVIGLTFNDFFCVGIILFALISYRKLHVKPKKIMEDLKNSTKMISELKGSFKEKLNEIYLKDAMFNEEVVETQWQDYKDSISEIEESDKDVIYEIDRYFSQVNLIELPGKRKIAEIIPGILTALGILGTFLGLLAGVNGLDTASAEALRGSIGLLLGAMSVAFSSSITGIITSLFWSYFDRRLFKDSLEALSDFNDVFNRQFPSSTRDSVLGRIEELQKEQTGILKTLGSDVAMQISKAFEETINTNIMPAVDSISGVIKDFASVATENQTDGLNKVVDNFLEAMNESMKGQFENLGNTIEELCKWQLETKESLDGLIGELKETTLNQKELNVSTEEIITKFSEYFSKLVEANGSLFDSLNGLESVVESIDSLYKSSNTAIESLEERNNELQESNKKYFSLIETNTTRIKSIMEDYDKTLGGLNSGLSESSEAFATQLNNGLSSTFSSFDKNLSDIVLRLSGTIEEIRESVDRLPKTVNDVGIDVEANIKKMNETVKKIDDSIGKIPGIINKYSAERTA